MSAKSEKVLTAKIAEKAVARGDYDLNAYTEIEDSAGEVLAKHKGYIQLNGIRRLPESLARILAKHKGGLSLGGITSLSDEIAAVLAKHQDSLYLGGLKILSPASALLLTQNPRDLGLSGLTDIPAELLRILAKHKKTLYLGGLTDISLEAAQVFSEHEGGLFLEGIKTLSLEKARILTKHPGHLALGIENLSDEILDIFSEREDGVYIYSLYDIEAVARAKYSDEREFIVSLSFEYCGVSYRGFRIMTKREVRNLAAALKTGVKIGTPNMPGDWYEEFDISLLKDCFAIHSPWPSFIRAMRKVFFGEESVGETSLFDSVLEHAPAGDD